MNDARRLALILATRQEQAAGSCAPSEQVVNRARIYLRFLQESGIGGGSNEELPRARPSLAVVRDS
jgi:hypothetical protein